MSFPRLPSRLHAGVIVLVATTFLTFDSAEGQTEPPIVQPGAPGEPGRQISAQEASNLSEIGFTDADVKFMQGMISHHAQALEMTELLASRSEREVMHELARRIELSQADEIHMMQEWLRERGQEVPAVDAHHAHGSVLMPGMLTPEEMGRLAQARAIEFDRLFLELMIKHHQGALIMVDDLLSQPGAAQDSAIFGFTNDITADQSMEIERMGTMLAELSLDPRANLKAGFRDAGVATFNLELVAALPKPEGFFDPRAPAGLPVPPEREEVEEEPEEEPEASSDSGDEGGDNEESGSPRRNPGIMNFANSDLAFAHSLVFEGSFHGFNTYNVEDPTAPRLLGSVVCPGGQGDLSVVGNLLIMSVEQTRGRLDCGLQGVARRLR